MAGSALQSALLLAKIILSECDYHKKQKVFTGRERLKKIFIRQSGRTIHMSTLDRYIHILTYGKLLKRWQTRVSGSYIGKRFESAYSVVTKQGLKALEEFGYTAYEIMSGIKSAMKAERESTRLKDVKRVGSGEAAPLGTVIKKMLKLPVLS
jgi:hypothetical protein